MPLVIKNPSLLPSDISVFYCWQDHLDRKIHRFLIRDAIMAAISLAQEDIGDAAACILRLDMDTLNRAGSVDIANTILEKIRGCTVVVADVTPVLADAAHERYYPNPNVMLELGYAAATVGWNRVICVFNEAVCRVEQLPFDIRHRRLVPYHCVDLAGRSPAKKLLEATLRAALRATIEEIAQGKAEPTTGLAGVQRSRDLKLLKRLMETLHRRTVDHFIERGLEHQWEDDAIFFWIGFEYMVCSAEFRFYDKELEKRVFDLLHVWRAIVHHGSYAFAPGRSGNLVLDRNYPWSDDYQQTVEKMDKAFKSMPVIFNHFLDHVHAHYPEIDMEETDKTAWEDNRPHFVGKRAGSGFKRK